MGDKNGVVNLIMLVLGLALVSYVISSLAVYFTWNLIIVDLLTVSKMKIWHAFCLMAFIKLAASKVTLRGGK